MASVGQAFFRLFRRESAAVLVEQPQASQSLRRSSGLAEFSRLLQGQESLSFLDLGSTSPQNIAYLTGLGHRVNNEDVLLSSLAPEYVDCSEKGKKTFAADKFLTENLRYTDQQFDAVLCWDIPDYLPEPLVKPLMERLSHVLKPGGALLAFFHTRDAGPDAPFFRYHICTTDEMALQRGPQFPLQRIYQNRHIEQLFKDFTNLKFFLARDNVREVLVTR